MDGREIPVGTTMAKDLFSVGGAHEGLVLEEGEILDEGDVKAAVELLREAIVQLQSDSDDPVCVGWWLDTASGLYYFDVSNVVKGESEAMALGRARREIAIFDLENTEEIRIDYVARRTGTGNMTYAQFMSNRKKALESRKSSSNVRESASRFMDGHQRMMRALADERDSI